MIQPSIQQAISERVLVLDGAMGVMIQGLGLSEADFRGQRFADHPVNLKGNNDILVLSRPEAIAAIHRAYLEAGADIIETNSFNANALSQREYATQALVGEINREAARLARAEADRFTALDPSRPRYVAGSIGPTGVSASLPSNVKDPSHRDVDFDQLAEAFREQAAGLIEGGVDLLQIETAYDALNVKACVAGVRKAMKDAGREVPYIISTTISDASGRLLSGHSIEAFLALIDFARPLALGFNCSAGPDGLMPYLRRLSEISPYPTIIYPNAGLPDDLGQYAATPGIFVSTMEKMLAEGLVNIAGGCCGTTPAHIVLLRKAVDSNPAPRKLPEGQVEWLAGIEPFSDRMGFINVGERCNVAGSRKFLRLVKEGQWDEAVAIARKQVADGAMCLDINMDDALLDTKSLMVRFLRLLGSDPATASVPWMIDSSDFDVIEAALQNVPGKAIVNSISLKKGEADFLREAAMIKDYGAAVVVMAFDEQGQATSFERRVEICSRAYKLLTERLGYNPRDIIFDPNILTVATGMHEHDAYAADFIRAVDWISKNLPGAKTSGGVSNLSFAFRGNNYIRQALHAVFLFHAIRHGMSMAIMDPGSKVAYADIPADLLEAMEDVVLNRCPDASERLIAMAAEATAAPEAQEAKAEGVRLPVAERLKLALRNGDESALEADLTEALAEFPDANAIVEGPLMQGMETVGRLFETGKMFLPQVVKSARVMHRAIEILRPQLEKGRQQGNYKGRYLIATVKGDVHDIGKNIVGVVLRCNNFEVIDLGVQVEPAAIVDAALKFKPDFIGLSGLISPSLNEMAITAKALAEAGVDVPLFVGGAATSPLHTALKIAPNYSGVVVRVGDAAQNPILASRLLSDPEGEAARIRMEQSWLVADHESPRREADKSHGLALDWDEEKKDFVAPSFTGVKVLDETPIAEIRPYINWTYFYNCWKVRPDSPEASDIHREAEALLDSLADEGATMRASVGFYPASSDGDSITIGKTTLPVRRQALSPSRDVCLSLADYIAPEGYGDHIGVFMVTIGDSIRRRLAATHSHDYEHILLQSVADRLAEATSEWLHRRVRTSLWGYSPDEPADMDAIRRGKYRGIRPAVGYPSLPDQSLMFTLTKLLDPAPLQVTVTENGALSPSSTVAGFYFANPHSKYFTV